MRDRGAKSTKGTKASKSLGAPKAPGEAEVVLDRAGAVAVAAVVKALNRWATSSETARRKACETMALEIFAGDPRAMLAPERHTNPRWAELLRRCDDELRFTPRQVEELARFAALDRLVPGHAWGGLSLSVKQALLPLVHGEALTSRRALNKLRAGAGHALSGRFDEESARRWVHAELVRTGRKVRASTLTRRGLTRRVRGAVDAFEGEDAAERFVELVGGMRAKDRKAFLEETERAAQAMLAAVEAARADGEG